jgi:N,N'-diacetylchitobiose transport system permease protein
MSVIENRTSQQGVQSPPPKRRGVTVRGKTLPFVFLAPAVVVLATMMGYPLVRMVLLAFQNMNNYRKFVNPGLVSYVGFDTFNAILSDPVFWQVIRRTLVWTALNVALSMVIAMAIAALLGRISPWARVTLITVLLFVWSMPTIVTGTVFRWLFDNAYGVIDYILYLCGGKGMLHHDWFADPTQGLYVVVTSVVVWGALPFLVLALHAGMTQVPSELKEAARVDGASTLQVYRNVTLPILRPLLMITTALSFIWDFQVFNQIWTMRNGAPEQGYWTIGVYLFEQAFDRNRYSDGAVISLAMIVVMLLVLVFYIRQMLRIGDQK